MSRWVREYSFRRRPSSGIGRRRAARRTEASAPVLAGLGRARELACASAGRLRLIGGRLRRRCEKMIPSEDRRRRDLEWMRVALDEAARAADHGDVPVGCLVVSADGEELGRGRNRRELEGDPTAHAEILALRAAASRRGHWRLEGATVYVTLEPCAMCAGALVNARIARLVFGATDPKAGAVVSLFELGTDPRLNHRFGVEGGLLADGAVSQLQAFFGALRARGEK